jgi:hypothetical protein
MKAGSVYVWHDKNGNILAIGKPIEDGCERVTPIAFHREHGILEIEADGLHVDALRETHHVDVKMRRLISNSNA